MKAGCVSTSPRRVRFSPRRSTGWMTPFETCEVKQRRTLPQRHRRPRHRRQLRIGQRLARDRRQRLDLPRHVRRGRRRQWRRRYRLPGWKRRRRNRRRPARGRKRCDRSRRRRLLPVSGPRGRRGSLLGHHRNQLLLARLQLLDAGLERFDLLPGIGKIARHRLDRWLVGRRGGSSRRDGFRSGRGLRRRLRRGVSSHPPRLRPKPVAQEVPFSRRRR